MIRPRACVFAATLLACGPPPPRLERGNVAVFVDVDLGSINVERDGVSVWRTVDEPIDGSHDETRPGDAYAPLSVAHTEHRTVDELFGFFAFDDVISDYEAVAITGATLDDERLVLELGDGASGHLELADDGAVLLRFQSDAHDRHAVSLACDDEHRFFGAGAQVSHEHRGYRVPIWTQEQGLGKTERGEERVLFGLTGDHYDSYAPVPFLLRSDGGGAWLDSTYRSELEVCERGALRLEVQGPVMDLWLFTAPSMAETLRDFTGRTGRLAPVPRWALAPWVDIFGGPPAVFDHVATLRAENIAASAVWSEDWVGTLFALGGENLTYDWEVDATRFPDLGALTADLHAQGLRFLAYVNPYIPDDTQVYPDLLAADGLVRDDAGEVIALSFPFGAPPAFFDATAPDAREVFFDYMHAAVDLGVDGWMADYGEAMPYDGVLADGRTGEASHNDYPLVWAQVNRDFWESRRDDGDYVTFNRAGFTGLSARAPVHWLGDQLTNWDRNDGIGSVVPLALSAGLSGIALTHSDIGGYTNVGTAARDFELWARWLALGAFMPVLRTHHGSNPSVNVQWYDDAQTRALFGSYARWHQRLIPYFVTLLDEAASSGAPAVRPLWWGHEDAVALYAIDDAFLVGADLLVAPIVTQSALERAVTLPPGSWRRWRAFDDAPEAAESGTVTLEAAPEETTLYVRAGAALPVLDRDYDSFVVPRAGETFDPAVSVAPALIDTLHLILVAGGTGDGRLQGSSFAELEWSFGGADLEPGGLLELEDFPACSGANDVDCLDGEVARIGPAHLDGGALAIVTASGEATVTLLGPTLERVTVEVR